jgi:Xaa-Pro aminopeptidase
MDCVRLPQGARAVVCAALLCALFRASGVAADPEYRARRDALRKAVPEGVIVLSGATQEIEDLRSPFFQEPNFYYLTGWREPGARLLIDGHREILFLPRHDVQRERAMGPLAAADDPGINGKTGFATVLPIGRFDEEWHAAGPPANARAVQKALTRMRMTKSPVEIGLIERSIDATIAAHLAAWKSARAGMYEYQIAALMMAVYLDRGCERSPYAPIVGSGPDGLFLHYNRGSRRMEQGELLLMDVGAECAGYAADVTRTIPVDGHFTPRQREIYDIVLGAQKSVIAAVKPGMAIGRTHSQPNSLYRVAYDYLDTHGRDLHGEPLGQYFIHGVSHHIGLEVHDASDIDAPLAEGMVISVEPGLYIPEEQMGIRIEDMVVVTHNGCRVLTASLPREAAEIERIMAR